MTESGLTHDFEQAVDEIYAWVDEQVRLAAPRCEISGRCCRFREYGHRLYISGVEAERLFVQPLPDCVTVEQAEPEQVRHQCPYQVNGRCEAREHRPLGCRIFFCDPEFEQRGCEITEEALSRLKQVYAQFDREWDYRELADFFAERSAGESSESH